MTQYRSSLALELMLVGTAGMCLGVSATMLAVVAVIKGPQAAIKLLRPKP